MKMRKSYLEAVKEHNAYGYIAENYWKMSKEELKDCCLEAIYQLSVKQLDKMADFIETDYEMDEEEW